MFKTLLHRISKKYYPFKIDSQKYYFKNVNNSKLDKNLFYLKIEKENVCIYPIILENINKKILFNTRMFVFCRA